MKSLARWLCALAALGSVSAGARAQEVVVKVGIAKALATAATMIAIEKGYFREAGVKVEVSELDSAANAMALLAQGQFNIVEGGISVGFFNAIERGLPVGIVADRVSTPLNHKLLIRADLKDKIKSPADLKGRVIASNGPGAVTTYEIAKILKAGGLSIDDIDVKVLSFVQMGVALTNKAVDAALPAEPATTQAVERGFATKLLGDDVAYPNHEIAVIYFTGKFVGEKPDVAKRFLKAFLRGVRDHDDALGPDGKLVGEKGEAIIKILNEYTPIKDPQFYRNFPLAACNPDGTINVESIATDLAAFKAQGLIEGDVDLAKVVDTRFLDAAVKELGPYKK